MKSSLLCIGFGWSLIIIVFASLLFLFDLFCDGLLSLLVSLHLCFAVCPCPAEMYTLPAAYRAGRALTLGRWSLRLSGSCCFCRDSYWFSLSPSRQWSSDESIWLLPHSFHSVLVSGVPAGSYWQARVTRHRSTFVPMGRGVFT